MFLVDEQRNLHHYIALLAYCNLLCQAHCQAQPEQYKLVVNLVVQDITSTHLKTNLGQSIGNDAESAKSILQTIINLVHISAYAM